MRKIFFILLFVAAFFFYWNTAQRIENRTEAEDAYEYALMVESEEHPWGYHPHHLIYGPLMKTGYKALQASGYDGRAFGFLLIVSSLSAAGSLFYFFLFCYRRFSLRPVSSLMATGLLAVSYGFWRYAAEVEVVLPASFLILAALYYATYPEQSRRGLLFSLLFSVLAVLLHVMNTVAVFIAIPCFYLIRHQWKRALKHILLSGILVASVYGIMMKYNLISSAGGMPVFSIGLGSLIKALVALCQCVVSGDFVLGFLSVRAFLSQLFATRMLEEEFYLGTRLSRPLVLFSFLTFIMFWGLFISSISRAVWIWKNMVQHRDRFQLPTGLAALAVAAVWFFGYAVLLLFIEPGNPELWVMGLVPLWLMFCGLVLLPLTFDNKLWLPFAMFLLLFIHNGFGGIALLHDSSKDYHQQKSRWLLEHATMSDTVITAADPVFERYLRYHFPGEVCYLYAQSPGDLQSGLLPETAGELYMTGDVFKPIRSQRMRFSEQAEWVSVYAHQMEHLVLKIHSDEFGGVYKVNTKDD